MFKIIFTSNEQYSHELAKSIIAVRLQITNDAASIYKLYKNRKNELLNIKIFYKYYTKYN